MRYVAKCCCGADVTFDSSGSEDSWVLDRVQKDYERWMAQHDPCGRDKYHIKPEPIECWAVVHDDGSVNLGFTDKARVADYYQDGSRVIRMREVL